MAMHVVGLFDDTAEAQAVVRDLEAAGFDSNTIDLHTGTASGMVSYLTGISVPEPDAHAYAEAIRRGGSLVTVHTQTDAEAQQAADIMNRHNSVDIENRSTEYRAAGWTRFDEDVDYSTATTTDRDTAYVDRDTTYAETTGARGDTDVRGPTQPTDEAVIPVVEEDLRVGKREVDRGGVRVNVDVEETPVEEQVTLREERVRVDRRPVDRPVSDADAAAVQEGTVEVRERGEEAVVDKQARVTEEIGISKDVEERTETVRDTVRRTDVDVDETSGQTRGSGLTDRIEGATGVDIDRDDDVAGRPPRR